MGFYKLTATRAGQAIEAKFLAGGAKIPWSVIQTSVEDFSNLSVEDIEKMATIENVTQEYDLGMIRNEGELLVINAAVPNNDVTEGYYINTYAICADDPELGRVAMYIGTQDTYTSPSGVEMSGADYMFPTKVLGTTTFAWLPKNEIGKSNHAETQVFMPPGGLVTNEILEFYLGDLYSQVLHEETGTFTLTAGASGESAEGTWIKQGSKVRIVVNNMPWLTPPVTEANPGMGYKYETELIGLPFAAKIDSSVLAVENYTGWSVNLNIKKDSNSFKINPPKYYYEGATPEQSHFRDYDPTTYFYPNSLNLSIEYETDYEIPQSQTDFNALAEAIATLQKRLDGYNNE